MPVNQTKTENCPNPPTWTNWAHQKGVEAASAFTRALSTTASAVSQAGHIGIVGVTAIASQVPTIVAAPVGDFFGANGNYTMGNGTVSGDDTTAMVASMAANGAFLLGVAGALGIAATYKRYKDRAEERLMHVEDTESQADLVEMAELAPNVQETARLRLEIERMNELLEQTASVMTAAKAELGHLQEQLNVYIAEQDDGLADGSETETTAPEGAFMTIRPELESIPSVNRPVVSEHVHDFRASRAARRELGGNPRQLVEESEPLVKKKTGVSSRGIGAV